MNGIAFSYRAKIVTVCLIIAVGLVFLYTVRHLLPPFIWAMIVAYVFNPLVTEFSRRTRLHRFWGVALLYAIMGGTLFLAAVYILPPLRRESEQLSRDFPQLVRSLYLYLVGHDNIELLGFRLDSESVARDITDALQKLSASAANYALPVFFGVLEMVTKVLMFLFSLFYFLLEADRIGEFLRRLLPLPVKDEVLALADEIDDVLGRWVRGQLVLVLIMSTATWVALTLLGVRYALVLAILTGILEIFPIVGPVTAGTIACLVALFQPNPFGWSNIAYVAAIAAVYFVLRHAEDYFVIPYVIGRIVEFHPLAVLFAVFAGGTIAGVLGMFIAAPVLAVAKIVLRYLYAKVLEQPVLQEVKPRAPVVAGNGASVREGETAISEIEG